jgi:glucose/arabinose dehydrogenase
MKTAIVLTFFILLAGHAWGQSFTQRIVNRLRRPLYATSPPGDPSRLFIVEQGSGDTANVRILDLNSNELLPDPFVTLTGLTTAGERGLLGMAFHPDYADNGKFYLYASKPGGTQSHRSHLFEYQVLGDPLTSSIADPGSEKTILTFDQPFGNHNGGWIGFDPTASGDAQNYLYVTTGDGGSGGDPRNNAQDITNNLLGKILRIDVAGDDFSASDRNYAIPPSNPFVSAEGDDEIWAYGLRNPWRISFDRETGDLWIGDVGQDLLEEIDFLAAGTSGQNFGWRVMEGNACFDGGQFRGNPPCNDPGLVPAIFDYGHGNGATEGFSVTGGYLYRGSVKEFQGHYFFADFVSNNIWTLDPYAATISALRQNDALEADAGRPAAIASFAEDANGELYIVSNTGAIYKVSSTSRDSTWVGSDATSGVAGDGVTWDDTSNWVRDLVADAGFTPGDHLVIAGDDPQTVLTPPEPLTVSSLTFTSSATFRGDAQLVSGNLTVEDGATAMVDGALTAATQLNTIRKLGAGRLELRVTNGSRVPLYALLDGTTTLVNTPPDSPGQGSVSAADILISGGQLEQKHEELSPRIQHLTIADDGSLRLLSPTQLDSFQDAVENVILDVESAQLGGSLEVVLAGDPQFPTASGGQIWIPLINSASRLIGEFDSVLVNDANLGYQGDGTFLLVDGESLSNGRTLTLVAYRAIPGDANGDRQVNFEDFLIVSDNFASEGGWTMGNFDSDNRVMFSDFLALSSNFGVNLVPAFAAPVPEPSCWLLLLVGLGLSSITRVRSRV